MNPIRFGSVVNLQSQAGSHPYLDSRGRVQDKSQFNGSPEKVFVSTYPSMNRHRGSGSWSVVSADGKTTGTPLSYGDRVHLLNEYPGVGYLDLCSRSHDFTPFRGYPDAWVVFTSGDPSRDGGSGTWIVESAAGSASGTPVLEGDVLFLRSAVDAAGRLYSYGAVRDNPTFAEYDGTESFVFVGPDSATEAPARSWRVTLGVTHPAFELDDDTLAGLISMTHPSSGFQYSIELGGDAITDGTPPLHFDTGSWDVCIPEKFVSGSCKPVEGAVDTKPWGLESVRMTGDFIVRTVGRPKSDGTGRTGVVEYELKDFVFFKLLDNEANKKAKSNLDHLKGIVGAFPSKSPYTTLPSLSYALAEAAKAADPARFGFGLISQPPKNTEGGVKDVAAGWSAFQSYLAVGAGPEILRHAAWRSDIPLWHTGLDFCPEAVPGFVAEVTIPTSAQKITSTQLIATIDTGAPDFTARLGDTDPHLEAPFAEHFTDVGGPDWWKGNEQYKKDARYLTNATVRIRFTDDLGVTRFYSFEVGAKYESPATFVAAPWDSAVPWAIDTQQFPRNRANLGNTIYYYAGIMYYDLASKRVGLSFR